MRLAAPGWARVLVGVDGAKTLWITARPVALPGLSSLDLPTIGSRGHRVRSQRESGMSLAGQFDDAGRRNCLG